MAEHRLEVVEHVEDEHVPGRQAAQGDPPPREVYLCGKCGIIVARDVPPEVLRYGVIRCLNCGASNRLPATDRDVVGGKATRLHRLRGEK
jgi:rubrerythrin